MGEVIYLPAFMPTRNPNLPPVPVNASTIDFPGWVKETKCVYRRHSYMVQTPHGIVRMEGIKLNGSRRKSSQSR